MTALMRADVSRSFASFFGFAFTGKAFAGLAEREKGAAS